MSLALLYIQTGPLVAVDDERMHASVLAQSYNHQATRDYANPHRPPDVRRRPDAESYRVYAQPDAAPPGSSVDQLAEDARGYSGTQRAGPVAYPYTRSDQPAAKAADHEVASMRCETCSRPAMFVCSACKKAPYCSVDCQVCHNALQTFPGQVILRNFHVHNVCKYQLYSPSHTICRYTDRLLMCACRPTVSIRGLFGKARSPTMGKA